MMTKRKINMIIDGDRNMKNTMIIRSQPGKLHMISFQLRERSQMSKFNVNSKMEISFQKLSSGELSSVDLIRASSKDGTTLKNQSSVTNAPETGWTH